MSSQRSTFLKRQRETDLKDKAKRKEAKRNEKRGQGPGAAKGPVIDWDAAVTETDSSLEDPAAAVSTPENPDTSDSYSSDTPPTSAPRER